MERSVTGTVPHIERPHIISDLEDEHNEKQEDQKEV